MTSEPHRPPRAAGREKKEEDRKPGSPRPGKKGAPRAQSPPPPGCPEGAGLKQTPVSGEVTEGKGHGSVDCLTPHRHQTPPSRRGGAVQGQGGECRPSRPIKGGSRNSGTAVGSPAPERDRHEEGARSLARWGFSRVLPGLKDVPGEAAAGAWGSRGLWKTRRDLGDPAARRARGANVGVAPRRGAEAMRPPLPGPRATNPGVAAYRGGGARVPSGPASQDGPALSRPAGSAPRQAPPSRPAPRPHSRLRPPSAPAPVCSVVPFSSGLKY
ncbi:uncharacterized protein LOC103725152 [Nannospalax galili]|uniref:uncharacterized protein LOC103725152 n=1 Tax=Nannospalax galili TaxID=1026970 RepID=UPI0004ED1545|nr:uncharacterized protein LOC103725152 [Nannospalax galili]